MAPSSALLSRPAEAGAQLPLAPLASDGQLVPLVQGGSARWVNLDYAASAPALRAVADHVAQVLPLYASVHRGAELRLRGVHRRLRGGQAAGRGLCRRPPRRRGGLHPQHHGRAEPAGHRGARRGRSPGYRASRQPAALAGARRPAGARAAPPWPHARRGRGGTAPAARRPCSRSPARPTSPASAAACAARRDRAPARRQARGRRRPACAAPPRRPVRHRRGLPGAFRPQDVCAVRRGRADRPPRLAGRRARLPGRRRRGPRGDPSIRPAGRLPRRGTRQAPRRARRARPCRGVPRASRAARRRRRGARGRRCSAGSTKGSPPSARGCCASGRTRADRVPAVSFTVPGYAPARVAAYLSAEHGIGVRDGKFCAHPLLARLGAADGAVRVSLGLGSQAVISTGWSRPSADSAPTGRRGATPPTIVPARTPGRSPTGHGPTWHTARLAVSGRLAGRTRKRPSRAGLARERGHRADRRPPLPHGANPASRPACSRAAGRRRAASA